MASLRYSRRAEDDLLGIARYTRRMWGETQVEIYLGELEDCCVGLAANPLLGRPCAEVSPGLRRMERGQHVVFYRLRGKGIVVVRVLHRAVMPRRWNIGGS